ncbi:hypothetical protein FK371_00365 [Salmonella enterica subsp. enterica serovar Derby]|nr:hypothetical protein [Salmonella enterica subsp. enterica serovar Derby]EFZ9343858.1 hypothetical protein [Salmonella enterica subsp. enterica serovar Derby]
MGNSLTRTYTAVDTLWDKTHRTSVRNANAFFLIGGWIDQETGPHEESEDRQALSCSQQALSSWLELEAVETAPQ